MMTTENNRLHNGQFAKGNPGKPKGSSKNKLRDEIRFFLNENWKDFPTWFNELKPKEKIETMLDLMPYAVYRLQSVSISEEDKNQKYEEDTEKDSIDFSVWAEHDIRLMLSLIDKYKTNG